MTAIVTNERVVCAKRRSISARLYAFVSFSNVAGCCSKMTLIVAAIRPGFAVVAADRLASGAVSADGAPLFHYHTKIVIAEKRQMLGYSGGFASLRERHTQEWLLDAMNATRLLPPEAVEESIKNRLKRDLLDAAIEAKGRATKRLDESHVNANVIHFLDGSVHVSKILLPGPDNAPARIELQTIPIVGAGSGAIVASEELRERLEARYGGIGGICGDTIADPDKAAQHLRDVVEEGARIDEELHPGQLREVGGGVDVAFVDSLTARFLINERRDEP